MTGPGIYHGSISYSSQEAGDGVIDSAQLLPYPSAGSRFDKGDMDSPYPGRTPGAATPPPEYTTSMALTAHHFLLLYRDRVRVVRMLDDRVVFEEQLDLVGFLSEALKEAQTDLKLVPSLNSARTSKSELSLQTLCARRTGCTQTRPSSNSQLPMRTRICGKCTSTSNRSTLP